MKNVSRLLSILGHEKFRESTVGIQFLQVRYDDFTVITDFYSLFYLYHFYTVGM